MSSTYSKDHQWETIRDQALIPDIFAGAICTGRNLASVYAAYQSKEIPREKVTVESMVADGVKDRMSEIVSETVAAEISHDLLYTSDECPWMVSKPAGFIYTKTEKGVYWIHYGHADSWDKKTPKWAIYRSAHMAAVHEIHDIAFVVIVVITGNEVQHRRLTVGWLKPYIKKVIAKEKAFRENHLIPKVIPSQGLDRNLKKIYEAHTQGMFTEVNPEDMKTLEEYKTACKMEAMFRKYKEGLRAKVLTLFAGNTILRSRNTPVAEIKRYDCVTVDRKKLLKSAFADLYTKKKESYRLIVK